MAIKTTLRPSTEMKKKDIEQVEVASVPPPHVAIASDDTRVSAKTWVVIFVGVHSQLTVFYFANLSQILSSTFGLSFWPVPTTAAMQGILGTKLGSATSVYWYSEWIVVNPLHAYIDSEQYRRIPPLTLSAS